MEPGIIEVGFEAGTLNVGGAAAPQLAALPGCQLDPRLGTYRAEARHYRSLIEHLHRHKIPFSDKALAYQRTPWPLRISRDPFPHQVEALETWWNRGARGVVVLPTGTGKTHLA